MKKVQNPVLFHIRKTTIIVHKCVKTDAYRIFFYMILSYISQISTEAHLGSPKYIILIQNHEFKSFQ